MPPAFLIGIKIFRERLLIDAEMQLFSKFLVTMFFSFVFVAILNALVTALATLGVNQQTISEISNVKNFLSNVTLNISLWGLYYLAVKNHVI